MAIANPECPLFSNWGVGVDIRLDTAIGKHEFSTLNAEAAKKIRVHDVEAWGTRLEDQQAVGGCGGCAMNARDTLSNHPHLRYRAIEQLVSGSWVNIRGIKTGASSCHLACARLIVEEGG